MTGFDIEASWECWWTGVKTILSIINKTSINVQFSFISKYTDALNEAQVRGLNFSILIFHNTSLSLSQHFIQVQPYSLLDSQFSIPFIYTYLAGVSLAKAQFILGLSGVIRGFRNKVLINFDSTAQLSWDNNSVNI